MSLASPRSGAPVRALLAGLAALALGVGLARLWLPEWRPGPIPPPAFFTARFDALARSIGWQPAAGGSPPDLVSSKAYGTTVERLGGAALPWLERSRTALVVGIERSATGAAGSEPFTADFALDGTLFQFSRFTIDFTRIFNPAPEKPDEPLLASRLLRPGERLGPGVFTDRNGGGRSAVYPILSAAAPAAPAAVGRGDYAVLDESWVMTHVERSAASSTRLPAAGIVRGLRLAAVVVASSVLFFGLLVRRKISLVNGALIGALVLAIGLRDLSGLGYGLLANLAVVFFVVGSALWTMVLWSTGESLLRTSHEGLTTSLDALRHGRLGPRAGRALLVGLGCGAALAGLRLAAAAIASRLPGCWPLAQSLTLPAFSSGGEVADGVRSAALAAFALGLGRRAPRWKRAAATAVALVALPSGLLHPWPLALALSLAVAALLVEVGRRAGLTALLATGLASSLLPAAVFAAAHLDWLGGTFALAAGGSAALLGLGVFGLARSPEVELGRMAAPAFVRRIEEERRVKYEMDLLTRMQEGLLPARLPEVAGWEIAARSLLATEAGGDLYDLIRPDGSDSLWIAMGDVAGHGYSCAILQAMTIAALTSLIGPELNPAGVLAEIDRVLRRGGSDRLFTSLALLRLDPASGELVLANAGHPYPFLCEGGAVREIELPGLPLGKGPPREYRDLALRVAPGGVLVLASDGLFEAVDARGDAYGFQRPASVLAATARRPAEAIVEALLADWRRHLGGEEPADDTTVVVLKRRL